MRRISQDGLFAFAFNCICIWGHCLTCHFMRGRLFVIWHANYVLSIPELSIISPHAGMRGKLSISITMTGTNSLLYSVTRSSNNTGGVMPMV